MDLFFQSLKISYYLNLLMYLTSFGGLIVSILKRRKFPILKYFPIYFLFSFLQSIVAEGSNGLPEMQGFRLTNASVNVFICCEFLIISNFFYNLKLSAKFQKFVIISLIIFYGFVFGMWATKGNFFDYPYELFIFEPLFAIPLPLTYFYYLFKDPPIKELSKDPTFWISSGILFYFTTTLPFFLVSTKVEWEVYKLLYSVNYISYAILFILIVRAYLCKPEALK